MLPNKSKLPSEPVKSRYVGDTSEFAKQNLVKPDTVRSRYCLTGSYFGVVPVTKLPNGRLVWPLKEHEARKEVA